MKSTFVNLLLLIIFIFPLGSCTEDETEDLLSFVDARDKFLGTWQVNNESCNQRRYQVTISRDPSNSAQVILDNFGFSKAAEPDTAIVAGNTITIPGQLNSEGWEISGTGNYEEGNIQWNYSLLISGDLFQCTATYTP